MTDLTSRRVLLLSAYNAHSHQYWQNQLINKFPQHEWQVLNLSDRYFAWRMGGNAMSFKAANHTALAAEYDLILATSMTDLCCLRGLYPQLSNIKNALYFHENQFAYPVNKRQQGLIEIQLRSIYAALAADQLIFNSAFNRNSFLEGSNKLLIQMPDGVPKDLHAVLESKSQVLPVPLADDCHQSKTNNKTDDDYLHVVWNHRWEHDKGPETLLEVIRLCQDKKIKFHILGQQFRQLPEAMQIIMEQHQSQCPNIGYIESRSKYIKILQSADVVLSTALHDFQGLSMLEAVACGCRPIAPNRLVYPELYPATNLYPPSSPAQEAQAIAALLQNHDLLKPVNVTCHWAHLESQYQQLLSLS